MNYDALERLARLRDQGALTEEEFAEQKQILFGQDKTVNSRRVITLNPFSSNSPIQKISAAVFMVGLISVIYSTFIYDVTISPLDAESYYSSPETPTFQEQARRMEEIVERLERARAGERIINLSRVVTQRRIFAFGALLMIIGSIGFVVPLARERRS